MYAATVNGRLLTFEVAGVWRRNMVIRDRETGTIWQQATGEAVAGPLVDLQLKVIGGEQTRWSAWRRDYPETVVAVEPADAPTGLLPRKILMLLLEVIPARLKGPGLQPNDTRLPSHTEVAGISLAGEARAYPLSVLREQGLVSDEVAGIPVAVVYDPAGDRVRAFERRLNGRSITLVAKDDSLANPEGTMRWDQRGEPISGTEKPLPSLSVERQWWLGWSEFHPGTSIYQISP